MSSSPVKSPLRFCLSCAATLACWVVWLGLGTALVMQLYIAVGKEVPVPAFVLRRLEAQLAAANFTAHFGRARLDPAGRLLLENVQLYSQKFEDPLLASRELYLSKSFWSVLAGHVIPDEIRLEGAFIQLPAPLSPGGTAEPVLRDVAGTLRYEEGLWHIDQLSFRAGNLDVHARGDVPAPRHAGPGGRLLQLDELTNRFLAFARKLALQLPQLQAADRPVLDLQLQPGLDGAVAITGRFTAAGLHRPGGRPLDTGAVRAGGDWLWSRAAAHSARLQIETDSLDFNRAVGARRVRGEVVLDPAADFSGLRQLEFHLAAADVTTLDESLDAPVFGGSYDFLTGSARLAVAVLAYGELLAASGQSELPRRAARVAVSGRVPPELVTRLLTRYAPPAEPYFRLGDPVAVDADLTLTGGAASGRFGGWRFGGLHALVHGGRLDSNGVQITSARGSIEIDRDLNFLAHDALLVAGENYARGSYWMNFRSLNYRMLLTGQLRPLDINGWFHKNWWANFWEHFLFPSAPPSADVDVQGCYRDYTRSVYFGSTDARDTVVLGADFARTRTLIFLRPQFTHMLELSAARADGTQLASGWAKRYADFGTHKLSGLEYDLQSNVEPAVLARMGGEAVQNRLAAWRFPAPPALHVWGHTEWDASGNDTDLRFTVRAPSGVEFAHFPFDALQLAGGFHANELHLDQVEFSVAGGTGAGKLTVGGLDATTLAAKAPLSSPVAPPAAPARPFSFELHVKDADLARTIRTVEEFEAARTGTRPAQFAGSKFLKRASGGRLELSVAAGGRTGALPDSLRGQGNVQITGAVLGEIHLFGLLSQALSAVALNFSSLKLDAARSSFQLDGGRVHFPDVKITGPSAVLDARGDYVFSTQSLDFTARLKPYEESHNPLTAVVGLVINPLTRIFELKLTGSLAKPDWSIVLGGSSPSPEANRPPAAQETPTVKPPPSGN
jgi:hypothetical protein